MIDSDAVRLTLDDGMVTVTIDRPNRRNALSREVSDGLREALATVKDHEARCLVVEGAGGAFSAGGDIAAMREGIEGEEPL
ncbi:enoyl-CoA hydratase-related protein [Halalkalicoccus tibetensis]|uniref:Enoyl-CoA hydratase-related protein n=1 Tax=Halalkalicoccus tibetensis TaxID=175632 RepID=A0ABD5V630_9EURY